jgi:predicted N-formylglutamate amidohydrolase
MADIALIVSCEHASNRVPPEYRALFADAAALLDSHRGYDAGALDVARALARAAGGAPLVAATATRLLVDLNRSLHHPKLFSELTRELSPEAKQRLVAKHYAPYRSRVEALIDERVSRGLFVLHVSAHSFTPVLDGRERDVDAALLYDPRRPAEKALADAWLAALAEVAPGWRLRRNHPYRGTADGFTTLLRKRFEGDRYAGIEIEVSQRLVADRAGWPESVRMIEEALRRGIPGSLRLGAAIAEDDRGTSRDTKDLQ